MYYGESLNSISHLVGAVFALVTLGALLALGIQTGGFATIVGWLASGGVAYSAGVFFYLLDKADRLPHAHEIWHFFVLVGSACHFIAVAGFVR